MFVADKFQNIEESIKNIEVQLVAKQVELGRKEQMGNANLYLTGDGLLVEKHTIQASFAFLETMFSWILQQYNDLLGQGGTEKECWEYVCHRVPKIFAYLHKAKLPGQGILTAEEQPVAIVQLCGVHCKLIRKWRS
jgi:hypothetical protein